MYLKTFNHKLQPYLWLKRNFHAAKRTAWWFWFILPQTGRIQILFPVLSPCPAPVALLPLSRRSRSAFGTPAHVYLHIKTTRSWHLKSLILQCFTSFVIQQLTKRQIPNKNGPLVIVLRDRTFLIRLLRFCRLGKLFQFVNSQRSRLSLCPLGCCSSSPPPCRCCWIKVTVWQILSQFIIWDYVRKRLHLSKALMAPASSLNTT